VGERCIYGAFLSCPILGVDVVNVGRPVSSVAAKETVKTVRHEGPLARRYESPISGLYIKFLHLPLCAASLSSSMLISVVTIFRSTSKSVESDPSSL
jgi:hypothetical protein